MDTMREVRPAAVAGAFYAADGPALRRQITWCFEHPIGPGARVPQAEQPARRVLGVVSPHAGYRYSGPVAAHAYHALSQGGIPDLVVVVGPNHHMLGAPIAVPACHAWRTPLGIAAVDHEAAAGLCTASPMVAMDDLAHELEHSVEVQVPFLQYLLEDKCRLLPVVMYRQDLEAGLELGNALATVLRGRKAVVVASTDLTHYETHASATRKDRWALRAIEDLDVEGLIEAIERHAITMCGPGPVMAAMIASHHWGATGGRTLKYATSGDVSGDYDRVVGYAALALE